MAGLTVGSERHDGRALLRLRGELDLATISILRQAVTAQLAEPGARELVLDLGELTFLDSSGLGALLQIRGQAQALDASLAMVNVPPAPARIIAIAGLNSTFGLGGDPGA